MPQGLGCHTHTHRTRDLIQLPRRPEGELCRAGCACRGEAAPVLSRGGGGAEPTLQTPSSWLRAATSVSCRARRGCPSPHLKASHRCREGASPHSCTHPPPQLLPLPGHPLGQLHRRPDMEEEGPPQALIKSRADWPVAPRAEESEARTLGQWEGPSTVHNQSPRAPSEEGSLLPSGQPAPQSHTTRSATRCAAQPSRLQPARSGRPRGPPRVSAFPRCSSSGEARPAPRGRSERLGVLRRLPPPPDTAVTAKAHFHPAAL